MPPLGQRPTPAARPRQHQRHRRPVGQHRPQRPQPVGDQLIQPQRPHRPEPEQSGQVTGVDPGLEGPIRIGVHEPRDVGGGVHGPGRAHQPTGLLAPHLASLTERVRAQPREHPSRAQALRVPGAGGGRDPRRHRLGHTQRHTQHPVGGDQVRQHTGQVPALPHHARIADHGCGRRVLTGHHLAQERVERRDRVRVAGGVLAHRTVRAPRGGRRGQGARPQRRRRNSAATVEDRPRHPHPQPIGLGPAIRTLPQMRPHPGVLSRFTHSEHPRGEYGGNPVVACVHRLSPLVSVPAPGADGSASNDANCRNPPRIRDFTVPSGTPS